MESHKYKGELGRNAMVGIAFGIIVTATILYVWTQGLPTETQTIPTKIQ